MTELTGKPGFAPPRAAKALWKQGSAAVELIATAALTVSLVIAATAVSRGNKSPAHGDVGERPAMRMPVPQQ